MKLLTCNASAGISGVPSPAADYVELPLSLDQLLVEHPSSLRKLDSGVVCEYWAYDSLEQAMREIYKKCGLPSASSDSGRKSLCTNAVVNGVQIETMVRIFDHASPETTVDYVVIQSKRIKQMCEIDWIYNLAYG
jgi:hypothetical protein